MVEFQLPKLAVAGSTPVARSILPLLLLFVLTVPAPALAGGQEVSDLAVTDLDWQFRLNLPGAGFRLHSEDELTGTVAGFQAGAFDGDRWVVVSVAPVLGYEDVEDELRDHASLMASTLLFPYTSEEVGSWLGLRAWEVAGRTNEGVPAALWCRFVVREGFVYTLVITEVGADEVPVDIRNQAARAVELLDGPVTPRWQQWEPSLPFGPGWYLDGRRMVHASLGIAWEVPPQWVLLLNVDISLWDPESEFGARSPDEAWLFTVLGGNVGAVNVDAVRAELEERDITIPFLGGSLGLVRTEDPTGDVYSGSYVRDDGMGLDLDFVVPAGVGPDDAPAELGRLMASFVNLTEEEQAAAMARPEVTAGPNRIVGPGWSLSPTTYRDFERGIVWTLPKGAWRVRAGDQAAEREWGASLFLEDVGRGVRVHLSEHRWLKGPPRKRHLAVLDSHPEGSVATPPKKATLGGAKALHSSVRMELDGLVGTSEVWTVAQGKRTLAIGVDAFSDRLDTPEGEALVAEIVAGLRLEVDGLVAAVRRENLFTDYRLGIQWDAQGSDCVAMTPAQIAPVGTMMFCGGEAGGEFLAAVALGDAGRAPGQRELMLGQMTSGFVTRTGAVPAKGGESRLTVAGADWDVRRYVRPEGQVVGAVTEIQGLLIVYLHMLPEAADTSDAALAADLGRITLLEP